MEYRRLLFRSAFGALDRAIGLAGRNAIALREQLEVVDQRFHVVLPLLAGWWRHLVVVDHDRAGVGFQPAHALFDDPNRLAHLRHAHQVTVVAVTGDADGDIDIHLCVLRVRLLLEQFPGDAGAAQHRAAPAPCERPFRGDRAPGDGAVRLHANGRYPNTEK